MKSIQRFHRLARRSARIAALLALAIGAPRSTTAQVAGAPPFRVHAATGGMQSSPDVMSMSPDGAFVVVWMRSPQGMNGSRELTEVAGQRFNRDGVP